MKQGKSSKNLAICYVLLSCCFYSLLNCLLKKLGNHFSSYNLSFYRAFFSLITIIPFLAWQNFDFRNNIANFRLPNLMRALLSFLGIYCFNKSLVTTPLNQAIAVTFIIPIFMSLLAVVFFKERITLSKWWSMAAGFAGVVIVLQPSGDLFQPDVLWVIISSALWALSTVVVKSLTAYQKPHLIVFYMSLLSTIISAPLFIYNFELPNWHDVKWLTVLGICHNLAQIYSAKAFKLAKLTTLAPFDFIRMLLGIVLGYVFFDETIHLHTVVGATMIIVGAAINFNDEEPLPANSNITDKSPNHRPSKKR